MSKQVKWYHFWNLQSGALGGLIFGGVVAIVAFWIAFLLGVL